MRMKRTVPMRPATVLALALLGCTVGCVRRTLTITTEPSGAMIHLNDEEVGRSTITTDFLWYGDYDVIIRKEGYQTLATHMEIKAPWYQSIPIDFFAEVLWPGNFHDRHERHFTLGLAKIPTQEELLGRAKELRTRALGASK